MHLATIRAILATPDADDAAAPIFTDDHLIWTEDGEEVAQWNAVAATEGWGAITVRQENGPDGAARFFYTYQGRETECPVHGDRDDNLRSILCIADLVQHDATLYACNETSGYSEYAFAAARPAQWTALETEFGPAAMTRRFTRVQGTFDQFCAAFFQHDGAPSGAGDAQRPPWQTFARKHWLTICACAFLLLIVLSGEKR